MSPPPGASLFSDDVLGAGPAVLARDCLSTPPCRYFWMLLIATPLAEGSCCPLPAPASGWKPPNREVHCSQIQRLTRFETSFSIFSSLIPTSLKCNCSSAPYRFRQVTIKPFRKGADPCCFTEALASGGTQGRQRAFHFCLKIQREGSMFFKETEHLETRVQNSSTVPLQGTTAHQGKAEK